MNTSIAVILCTFPDVETAERTCTSLVSSGLVACSTLLPSATSIFTWKGAVQRSSEVQVIMKTSTSRVTDVMAHVTEHHPYEVPEFVVLDTSGGLPAYLQWVLDSTSPDVT